MTTEISFGRRISTGTDAVEAALRSGAHRLLSVRSTLLGKVGAALGDGFGVSEAWMVTDSCTFTEDQQEEKAARQALLDAHVEHISAALTTLTTEDKQVAFVLDTALDELRATTTDVRAGNEYLPPRSPGGMDRTEVTALLGSQRFHDWMAAHPDAAKAWLDGAVDQGLLDPTDQTYADFLKNYWQQQAFESAGIDPTTWDTTAGANANSETITKVYQYYGQLFLGHPEMAWAGMANLIGPSFAGGFYDLDMVRKIAQGVQEGTDRLPDIPGKTDDQVRELINKVAGMGDAEVNYYQSTLLGMQKEIFTDQASLHEAYLLGGTAETDRLNAAGVIDRDTGQAWRDIASGDPARMELGNDQLLHREQYDIIADDYDRMRAHPGTGEAFTYVVTAAGAPSIPGARSFSDVFPLAVDLGHTPDHLGPLPVPSTDLGEVVTPLPDGNIADREDRWQLIRQDTLPAYKDLLHQHPQELRDLVASDFDARTEDARTTRNIPELIDHLVTDWDYRR